MNERPYINLQQALKKYNLVSTGGEAKVVIQKGEVTVDGVIESRRGRKLYGNEQISHNGKVAIVGDVN